MADFDIKKFNQHSPSGSTCKSCARQCKNPKSDFCARYRYQNAPTVPPKPKEPQRLCKVCYRRLPVSDFPMAHGKANGRRCKQCVKDANLLAKERSRAKKLMGSV